MTTTTPTDWRDRASCRSADPNLWTTPTCRRNEDDPREHHTAVQQARTALRTCNTCPVKVECRNDPADPFPVSIIRGGIAYDYEGKPHRDCANPKCGRPVIGRHNTARHCQQSCAKATEHHRDLERRVAA